MKTGRAAYIASPGERVSIEVDSPPCFIKTGWHNPFPLRNGGVEVREVISQVLQWGFFFLLASRAAKPISTFSKRLHHWRTKHDHRAVFSASETPIRYLPVTGNHLRSET